MCCGCDGQIPTDYRSPVEKKGQRGCSLSDREGFSPCLDRVLLLFGYITSRMFLIYYAQVCFRWLPFTENKGEDVANYIRKGYLQM